jgi:hypothetical protein
VLAGPGAGLSPLGQRESTGDGGAGMGPATIKRPVLLGTTQPRMMKTWMSGGTGESPRCCPIGWMRLKQPAATAKPALNLPEGGEGVCLRAPVPSQPIPVNLLASDTCSWNGALCQARQTILCSPEASLEKAYLRQCESHGMEYRMRWGGDVSMAVHAGGEGMRSSHPGTSTFDRWWTRRGYGTGLDSMRTR